MIDSYEIANYLPINSGIPKASAFIVHHLTELQKCLENKLYSSSYYHIHLLFMIFIYFQLLRISEEREEEFSFSLIGLPGNEKDILKNAKSPFSFRFINEKTVFRFFRLVEFDDGLIGNISSVIEQRNKHNHVNEELICDTEDKLAIILNKYEQCMKTTLVNESHFIQEKFFKMLSRDFKDIDYELSADEVELNLIMPGYFSTNEIEMLKSIKYKHALITYLNKNY